MRKIAAWSVIIFVVSIMSCGQKQSFDYGKVTNNVYMNSFFNFSAELPQKWVIQTKKQTDKLTEVGKKLIAGEDKKMKAIVEASEVNAAYLLTVFKYEAGTAVDFNPSFMFVAENLKSTPGIKSGKEYLFSTRQLLKQSQVSYDYIDGDFKTTSIGGKEFYYMNASMKSAGLNIKQTYYSTVIKGFCLSLIISYASDEQKAELDKFVGLIKFNK